jgi:hypothetical protein
MGKDVQIIRNITETAGKDLPEKMMKDAFIALTLSLLGEFFLSGDTKMVVLQGMLGNLKDTGRYTEKEIDDFRECMNKVIKMFMTKNDFMG